VRERLQLLQFASVTLPGPSASLACYAPGVRGGAGCSCGIRPAVDQASRTPTQRGPESSRPGILGSSGGIAEGDARRVSGGTLTSGPSAALIRQSAWTSGLRQQHDFGQVAVDSSVVATAAMRPGAATHRPAWPAVCTALVFVLSCGVEARALLSTATDDLSTGASSITLAASPCPSTQGNFECAPLLAHCRRPCRQTQPLGPSFEPGQ